VVFVAGEGIAGLVIDEVLMTEAVGVKWWVAAT
jgi:hypothetical protein